MIEQCRGYLYFLDRQTFYRCENGNKTVLLDSQTPPNFCPGCARSVYAQFIGKVKKKVIKIVMIELPKSEWAEHGRSAS